MNSRNVKFLSPRYRSVPPQSAELQLGIGYFFTRTPGIGGKLRVNETDFCVDEIPCLPPASEEGDYIIAHIQAINWETNRLVRMLARRLQISRNRIRFAGTKDKKALTRQYFSFHGVDEKKLTALKLPRVELLDHYRSRSGLNMGDLLGNRFNIRLSKIRVQARTVQHIEKIKNELLSVGGFPNFFGPQRFGAVRPVTHLIGKHIIAGDFEQAVMTYIANPIEGEPKEIYEIRKMLERDRDFTTALKAFHKTFTFERAILHHLVRYPADYLGALNQLPKNLLLMFVHAYQSFLFNRILTARMERALPLNMPLEGDIVLPVNRNGIPTHEKHILVTGSNIRKIEAQVLSGKAFISGLLFGSKSIFAAGEQGEIEQKIITEEKLKPADFIVPEMPSLTTKGTRRELLAPLKKLEIEFRKDYADFRFELTKGCYATALMREFMKSSSLLDY